MPRYTFTVIVETNDSDDAITGQQIADELHSTLDYDAHHWGIITTRVNLHASKLAPRGDAARDTLVSERLNLGALRDGR